MRPKINDICRKIYFRNWFFALTLSLSLHPFHFTAQVFVLERCEFSIWHMPFINECVAVFVSFFPFLLSLKWVCVYGDTTEEKKTTSLDVSRFFIVIKSKLNVNFDVCTVTSHESSGYSIISMVACVLSYTTFLLLSLSNSEKCSN